MRQVLTFALAGALAITVPTLTPGLMPTAHAADGPGQASFAYTGAAQTWTIPSRVLSAYLTLIGGIGGSDGSGNTYNSPAAHLTGTLTWPSGTTQLGVFVGGIVVTPVVVDGQAAVLCCAASARASAGVRSPSEACGRWVL